MPFGYTQRILRVDLSERTVSEERMDERFYRTYVGGSCLGAYYLFREAPPGLDAFDPANVLVFAASPTTGAPISGASRFNLTAKSPLTETIGDSQGGGHWGAQLKFAGFDAIVIKGRAESPVYLWVCDGRAEIRDARHLWGLTTGEAQRQIRAELGDDRICVATIGPGGENRVRYAAVANNLRHFNGRNGMGAVMGAKNLKAVAVRGHQRLALYNEPAIRELARRGARAVADMPAMRELRDLGTASTVAYQQAVGGLPTRNYSSGVFDGADKISGQALRASLLAGADACFACAVRCKRIVKAEAPLAIDPQYGGPEYESIASLGSYLCIDDLAIVAKANELCNKYTLDTISTGGTVAFAMECFEHGLLTLKDTDGIDLRFGNGPALLAIIEKIARREGIGDLLAEGAARAARAIGRGSEAFAVHVKGQELPAHMPQVKASLALAYAANPFGADHMSSEHDDAIADEPLKEAHLALGLLRSSPAGELNEDKVRLWAYSQMAYSLLDTLDLCDFCFGTWPIYTFDDVVDLVNAATGWHTNLWELMKVGERRINLMRAFNAREGFTRADDRLPQRLFEPLSGGPTDGQRCDPQAVTSLLEEYYRLMGWDVTTGNPTPTKLRELGLDWVARALAERRVAP